MSWQTRTFKIKRATLSLPSTKADHFTGNVGSHLKQWALPDIKVSSMKGSSKYPSTAYEKKTEEGGFS